MQVRNCKVRGTIEPAESGHSCTSYHGMCYLLPDKVCLKNLVVPRRNARKSLLDGAVLALARRTSHGCHCTPPPFQPGRTPNSVLRATNSIVAN